VSLPVALRAEAIGGLADDAEAHRDLLFALTVDGDPLLRRQAVRSLRGVALRDDQRRHLEESGLGVLLRPESDASDREGLEAGGDPVEGTLVFFHPKGPGCYRCHQVDGRGGRIGPDLTPIGRGSDAKKLIESIRDPSREVAPQFTTFQIARKDGTVATGMLRAEDGEGAQIFADSGGTTFRIKPSDIEEKRPLPASIMADGLDRAMTADEFRSLVAFLRDPTHADGLDPKRGK
jgi:putative heme-binding domain-containing protein